MKISQKDIALISQVAYQSRLKTIDVANRVSGAHIGGIFSITDFLSTYYFLLKKKFNLNISFYKGSSQIPLDLIFSKGHCYLAQLSVLDSIFKKKSYCESYLTEGTSFFGHAKRIGSHIFPLSSGALGQGITFGNGIALSNSLSNKKNKTISIIGDGEMNEGSVTEALLFASHNKINHTIILDNNNQMSLNKTTSILSIGDLKKRIKSYGINYLEIDGHDYNQLTFIIKKHILDSNKTYPLFINLKTIKGKGVKFMEKNYKWHHRRFKNNEYQDALKDLYIIK